MAQMKQKTKSSPKSVAKMRLAVDSKKIISKSKKSAKVANKTATKTTKKTVKLTALQKLLREFPKMEWDQFSPSPVIGVDEVGRGCLAGPVYAAAVILNSADINNLVTDSKVISEKRRDELAEIIQASHQVGIGYATVEEIDELNIHWASMLAMKRAVQNLNVSSGHVLVDGNKKIPDLQGFEQTTVIKGDLRVAPISAASIVAKVTRDRLMKDLGVKFPQYGFEIHKGYSTAIHKDSILMHGPSIWHRKSFMGVKENLQLEFVEFEEVLAEEGSAELEANG